MAKISTYAPALTLTGIELIPGVQNGETVVLTPTMIATHVFAGYGANKFPARSSSGALGPKTITDFALTLLDDADAPTARATLGAGTVSSVDIANATGITFSGGPITGSGTITPTLSANLQAVSDLATTGLAARTGSGTFAARTITQPAAGITVTNGGGVAGNPTLALANDLAAVEGLSGTGIAVRTATDTWNSRTITGTANRLVVTNGNGVSGNPTLDLDPTFFTSGTYTPTLTNTTNLSSSTPQSCQYLRVGNTVTVSGVASVTATAAGGTLTQLGISLPIASALANANELAGAGALINAPAPIFADATNDRATVQWNSAATGALTLAFSFTYRVI